MNNVMTKVLFIGLGLVLLASCTEPLYNVSDSAITLMSGDEPDLEQVTKAILVAGITTPPGWSMTVVKPGHILASLRIREHFINVDITYTTESYNITYKNSTNLRYDAGENTIHRSYNRWLEHLDRTIRQNISLI